MLKRIVFFGAILLLDASRVGAQQGDSCFALADEFLNRVCPDNVNHNAWHNPDSCMIDSCAVLSSFNPCEFAYDQVYSKTGYRFNFDSDVFNLPVYPIDTILVMRWTDLDTSFHLLRDMFDSLQKQCGNFGLLKREPDRTNPDQLAGIYYMVFDSYTQAIVVSNFINDFSNHSIDFGYIGGPFIASDVSKSNGQTNKIFPNPVHSELNVSMPGTSVSIVEVYDMCGRLAREFELQNPSDIFTLDLTGLLPGVYAIRCGNQNYRIVFEP